MAKKKDIDLDDTLEPIDDLSELGDISDFEDDDELVDEYDPEIDIDSEEIEDESLESGYDPYPTENHKACKVRANTDPTIVENAPPYNPTLILRHKLKEG